MASKIMVISDLHLANRVNFGKPTINPTFIGCNTRFHAIAEAVNRYVDLAVKEGCEALVVPGDIWHERMILQVPVLNAVYSLFEEANNKIPTYIMTGNHDMVSAKALYGEEGLHSLYALKQVCNVIDNPCMTYTYSFNLCFVPFNISKDKTIADAKKLYENSKQRLKPSVVFFHHSFEGAVTGPTNWRMPSEIKPSDVPPFDVKLSGHLHHHQTLGGITYVGSLVQHDLGERTYSPGGLIVSDDGTWKHIPNEVSPKFVVIEAVTRKDLLLNRPQDYKVIKWLGDEKEGLEVREDMENSIVEIQSKEIKREARTNINNMDTIENMMKKYVTAKLGTNNEGVFTEGLSIYRNEVYNENIEF